MVYDRAAAQRRRRQEKREGTFVDKRFKATRQQLRLVEKPGRRKGTKIEGSGFKKFHLDTQLLDSLEQVWPTAIHHMTRDFYLDYSLKCECGELFSDNHHYHYLRFLDEDEWKAMKEHRLGTRKWKVEGHKGKDKRVKFKCLHHFICVLHYLRCRRASQNKLHKHRDFDQKSPFNLDLCKGHFCKDYKEYLATAFGIDDWAEAIRECIHCEAGRIRRKNKWHREKLEEARRQQSGKLMASRLLARAKKYPGAKVRRQP